MRLQTCHVRLVLALSLLVGIAQGLQAQPLPPATGGSATRSGDSGRGYQVTLNSGQEYRFANRSSAERFARQMNAIRGFEATVSAVPTARPSGRSERASASRTEADPAPPKTSAAAPSVLGTWRGNANDRTTFGATIVFHANGNGSLGRERDYANGSAQPFRWEQNGNEITYYFADGSGGVMAVEGGLLRVDGVGEFRRGQ